MKKNKIKTGIFGIFLLLVLSQVYGAGVSSPYWDENPLYMQPGETKEFNYYIQNMVGNEDIKMKVEVEGNTNIMSIIDGNTVYDVPLGKSDVPVRVKVNVPETAKEGEEYQVGLKFTIIAPDITGRPIAIGSAFSKGFKVIVGAKQTGLITEEAPRLQLSEGLVSFIILIIILIVLLFIIKRIYKKKENKNVK